jgi:hypothetical protein
MMIIDPRGAPTFWQLRHDPIIGRSVVIFCADQT